MKIKINAMFDWESKIGDVNLKGEIIPSGSSEEPVWFDSIEDAREFSRENLPVDWQLDFQDENGKSLIYK